MLLSLLFNCQQPRSAASLFTSTPVIFRGPAIVRRQMDDLLEEFDSIFEGPKWSSIAPVDSSSAASASLRMKCDVTETDESFVIRAELPGVPKEAINIEVLRNVLTIEAVKENDAKENKEVCEDEKKVKEEVKATTPRRFSERGYGTMKRSFGLPDSVLTDTPKTSFENGVLTVTFAKNQEMVKPRKLLID